MMFLKLMDIRLDVKTQREMLKGFLAEFGLLLDEDVEESIGLYDGKELVAVCCRSGKVLKGFAVRNSYREHNLTSSLVSEMIRRLFDKRIYKSFVFTRQKYKEKFESLGYRFIGQGGSAVLLETGLNGVDEYIARLKEQRSEGTVNGSIIMNCNPFTLGHRYLIKQAKSMCEVLFIIIVEEDSSLFPFSVRKQLIIEGIKDIPDIKVVDGGDYTISSATFPGYFFKKENDRIYSEAALDVNLFIKYTAPALNISKRFAGSEPFDYVTSVYNNVMRENLVKSGIEFIEIERLKSDDRYISATEVRKKICAGDFNSLHKLVPESTLNFIMSPEGEKISEKIIHKYRLLGEC